MLACHTRGRHTVYTRAVILYIVVCIPTYCIGKRTALHTHLHTCMCTAVCIPMFVHLEASASLWIAHMSERRRDARGFTRLGPTTSASPSGKQAPMVVRRRPSLRHTLARQAEPTISSESVSPMHGSTVSPTHQFRPSLEHVSRTCPLSMSVEHANQTCQSNMPVQHVDRRR